MHHYGLITFDTDHTSALGIDTLNSGECQSLKSKLAHAAHDVLNLSLIVVTLLLTAGPLFA